MSDYIYMLESRLGPEQNRVVEQVQAAAGGVGVNLFLTGGAMRDMLAGFPIRDLDFVVEGNALKVAKAICEEGGAEITAADEDRKTAEVAFPSGITIRIAMSRREKYGRAGSRPQIHPATIQEDLRGRDFTCNAIALSLNKASRGLLLDPMNGLADLERRELRAVSPYGFYDDPSRLLRLVRFRVRLGFTVDERTQTQVANAREAGVERGIPAHKLGEELRRIALEDKAGDIIQGLEEAGLLALFSPALSGPKLNLAGLKQFEAAAQLLPEQTQWRNARLSPFLFALTEKLPVRERQAFVKGVELTKAEVDGFTKLETRAKKLETALRSGRIRKASQAYQIVSAAAPPEVLFLLYHSAYKAVQDRLRAYFEKSLPALQEITPEEWAGVEGRPGTPRHEKARQAFIAARLDRRVPKPEPPAEPPPPPPPPPESPWARRR